MTVALTAPPRQPNVGLLRLVLTHIEMHPRQWRQSAWRTDCGTAYCFAGWTVLLSGGRFAVDPDDGYTLGWMVVPAGTDPTDTTQWRDIVGYAAELLRVPAADEMPRLFHPDNTLDDLRAIVAELSEGATS